MGGDQSKHQQDQYPNQGPSTQQQSSKQQHAKEEEQRLIREQRAMMIQKRLEEQKREEELKKQEVINFQNISDSSSNNTHKHEPSAQIKDEQMQAQVQHQQPVQQKVPQHQAEQQRLAAIQNLTNKISLQATEQKEHEQKAHIQEQIQTKPQPVQKPTVTKEQRVHNFISDVFQITNESSQSSDKKKTFLYEYCGEGKLFRLEDLDDIFFSRLSKNKDENKFVYLIQCYRRLESHLYVKEKIIENVVEIKDQIVSYFNTCLQCPETFNLSNNEVQVLDNDTMSSQQDMFMAMLAGQGMGQAFGEKLCSNQMFRFTQMQNQLWEAFEKEAIALHTEFMKQLVDIVKDDEDQTQILFSTLFDKMHLNMNSIKIEKFRQAESQVELLKILLDFKEAQQIFVKSPQFLRQGLNGKQIQTETYFGRYLSFSCLVQETRGFKDQYFKGMAKSSLGGILRMTEQVAEQFHNFHRSLQDVFSKLLKNKDTKEYVMQWLRQAVGLNFEKQKMQAMAPVASDGFIFNLIDLMLLFCKPFTSKFSEYYQQFSKVNCFYMVNDQYVVNGQKVEKIDNETVVQFLNNQLPNPIFTSITMEATQASSLDSDSANNWNLPQPNFITECFFLTHLLIHYMSEKTEKQYQQLQRMINKAAKEKDLNSFEEFMGMKMCIDAHICGKNTLANFRSLFTFTGALFIVMNNYEYYISSPEFFDNIDIFQTKFIKLPIEPIENMPLDIAALPSCILSNLGVFPKLWRQINPESYYGKDIDLHILLATNMSIVLNKRIKNPHIIADMITFPGYLVPQSFMNQGQQQKNQRNEREDNLYKDVFFQNPTLREYLIQAIVKVYIDCERTGYYEKAHYRFFSSMLMEYVWSDSQYREKFLQLGQIKPSQFIEFCNFLINDMNNLLFEGLLELEEIRNYEEVAESPDFHQIDQEQREQMTAKFEENKKKAQAHFQLVNMVIKLMAKVTIFFQTPFISEELGENFANALNFCIDSLVSQRGLKIKVNNPDRFNFDPRGLLINILNMYSNMSGEELFLKHVVNDPRSYKTETFEKAVRIINNPKKGVQLSQDSQSKFESMVSKLKDMKQEIDQEEGLYDDAPEEFLDPLMSTLMKEPVELPSSKTIIDYITIKKHLMNEPNDPFNRSPLTLEQLIPRNDIKERIEEYKEKKRQQRKQQIIGDGQ